MTGVKAYLWQVRKYTALINAKKRQLDRLRRERTYLSGVRYDRDRVQGGSPDPNRQSDKLLDLELEISRAVENAATVQNQIIREIGMLERVEYVDLLIYRYVDGMSFERIGEVMGYSYGRVTHLHGEALQAFGRIKGFNE